MPGNTNHAIFPGKTVSREAALRAIVIEGAKFLRVSHCIGSLEVGKLADIIVLDRDFFAVLATEIQQLHVLLNMAGGSVVHLTVPTSALILVSLRDADASAMEAKTNGRLWRSEFVAGGEEVGG